MSTDRTVVRSVNVASYTVTEVAYVPGSMLTPHAHDTARFAVVLSGEYHESCGDQRLHCTPGTITYRPPGTLHANSFIARTECLMIQAPETQRGLRVTRSGRAVAIANEIRRELTRSDAAAPLIAEGLLLQLIGLHDRAASADDAVPRWLREVHELVSAAPSRLSLHEIAGEWRVHPSHLATAFKRAFGCTIGEVQRRRRVERSVEMLRDSAWPLARIADACGFADQSHFTREFKRIAGVTPLAFRRDESRSKS